MPGTFNEKINSIGECEQDQGKHDHENQIVRLPGEIENSQYQQQGWYCEKIHRISLLLVRYIKVSITSFPRFNKIPQRNGYKKATYNGKRNKYSFAYLHHTERNDKRIQRDC